MKVLILGYGYSGYYCARKLLEHHHAVTAVSRSYPDKYFISDLNHIRSDIQDLTIASKIDAIIYCAPPLPLGVIDSLLSKTLIEIKNKNLIANIVYWGSSGVYGDHEGNWVDEDSKCNIKFDIQRRRLDAESQIQGFARENNIDWTIMRVAGMYGPDRLPKTNKAVIKTDQAPYSNMIYIKDAAKIAISCLLSKKHIGIINVCDGMPIKMGTLQRLIANKLKLPINEKDYLEILQTSSPMLKYFLSSSKRLSNDKCKKHFSEIYFSDLTEMAPKCIKI